MKTEKKAAPSAAKKPKCDSSVWATIKSEYIASTVSVRELARRHGLSETAIRKHVTKEGWCALRTEMSQKSSQMTIDKIAEQNANNANKAYVIINKVMDKLERSLDEVKDGDVQSIKQIVSAMKDLKDMSVYDLNTQTKDVSVSFVTKDGEDLAD